MVKSPPLDSAYKIQAGINASTDTDTVIVAGGTYMGFGNRDLNFGGRAITLKSQNGSAGTIIYCGGTTANPHRGFYFESQFVDINDASTRQLERVTIGWTSVTGSEPAASSILSQSRRHPTRLRPLIQPESHTGPQKHS